MQKIKTNIYRKFIEKIVVIFMVKWQVFDKGLTRYLDVKLLGEFDALITPERGDDGESLLEKIHGLEKNGYAGSRCYYSQTI